MKLLILETGEIRDIHGSRALRLMEQGKAVPVKEKTKAVKAKSGDA